MKRHKVLEFIVNLLFPRRCPVCDKPLAPQEELIHLQCKAKLPYVSGPVCYKCGKPVNHSEIQYCTDCSRRRHLFVQGKSLLVYNQIMEKSIAKYKYNGRREYGVYYSKQLLAVYGDWLTSLKADVIIPVPLHWKKQRDRGYNQAAVIAKYIGQSIHLPVDTKYLRRKTRTKPQKQLTPQQRYANLKQAFKIVKKNQKYRCIILVDDIYTTGSTIDACTKLLLEAGAKDVYFISVCIGSDREG